MPFVDEVIRLEVIALATVLGIVASIITIFRGIHAAGAWFSGNRAEARRIVFSTVLISVALMLPALLSGIGLFWIDNFIACSTTLYEEGSCPEAYTASYVLRIVYYFAIVSFIPSTLTLAAFHPVHRWLEHRQSPDCSSGPIGPGSRDGSFLALHGEIRRTRRVLLSAITGFSIADCILLVITHGDSGICFHKSQSRRGSPN